MTNTLFQTKFAGLELSSPIIIGSSGLTNSVEKNKELEKAGAGALVLKSLFQEQMTRQRPKPCPAGKDVEHPSPEWHIHNCLDNNRISDYLHLIQETKQQCQIPVIASINCYKEGAWIDFAHQIERAGADAIELNIFSLNTEKDTPNDLIENSYLQIMQKVKEAVSIPVIVKMSKYFSHLVNMASKLKEAGVAGIVLFNRLFQPDINMNTLQVSSGSLFSTPAELTDTLRWTSIINGRLPEISLASGTGIHDWEDIAKCILSGASAVEICSTVYLHGNEIIATMKRSLEEWMTGLNIHSISEIQGRLNYKEISNAPVYERSQFIKYFSNRD